MLKRFRIARTKDIFSLMQPCFFLCRLHGLFPYEVSAMGVSLSKPWYIISSIIMAIYASLGILIAYQKQKSGILEYDTVPGVLQEHCYCLICSFVGVITIVLSVSRVTFLQDLFKISRNVPSEAFQRIGTFVYIKDIFGFIFLVGQIPFIYDKSIYVILSKAYGMYATLVIFLTDTLYTDCVIVLYICFKNINENLIELKQNILTEESQLLMRFFHERRNPLLLLKLRTIKKIHHALSDVVEKLNLTFSYQIVASVTLTFAEVTFNLYFYILHNRDVMSINLERQIWYSYFITSIAFFCSKLVGTILMCQLTKNEAKKTGTLVHEILINTEESQFQEELKFFSLQILHRDNTFTAKGISLDASLITSVVYEGAKIVGGVTTYLLILIQFLVSGKSACEDN